MLSGFCRVQRIWEGRRPKPRGRGRNRVQGHSAERCLHGPVTKEHSRGGGRVHSGRPRAWCSCGNCGLCCPWRDPPLSRLRRSPWPEWGLHHSSSPAGPLGPISQRFLSCRPRVSCPQPRRRKPGGARDVFSFSPGAAGALKVGGLQHRTGAQKPGDQKENI